MMWLSTTTCTPRRTRKRLRPPLLHNMRFSLRWLHSMAKHKSLERILHLHAEKYMWSIHRCDDRSLGHCNTKWALPVRMLPRGGRPLGSGRQLPPQLTVGRRPLGVGGGGGGALEGGSRRGAGEGGSRGGGGGSRGSRGGGGGVGHLRTVGYAAQV